MASAHKEVAETCFCYLQMELVAMAMGSDIADASAPQLQAASRKIEFAGFQVGQRLAERYTKDAPRFAETIDIIKFICKDFWHEIYRKQIDKLQTNNRVSALPRPLKRVTLLLWPHPELASLRT